MIINQTTQEVTRTGASSESTFNISVTAKAFEILSSSIYSNKPLAIVRELSCNMIDGHLAAGNMQRAPEIELPTYLKPEIIFRDFGTGLLEDQICGKIVKAGEELKSGKIADVDTFENGIYTTYFESDKTHSNQMIGGLGLGSKSPFSYVDAFTVESRQAGVKKIYTAFKNEEGLPSIVKLHEETTDEPNGMTVSLPVKSEDCNKFRDAAQRALMYFNPSPIFVNEPDFKVHSMKHLLTGNNWALRETPYYAGMSGPFVVQGTVAYPVDNGSMDVGTMSAIAKQLMSTNIDIMMDIGSVSVAPSREALSYDKKTIANIRAKLEEMAVEITADIQQKYADCDNQWDAALITNQLYHDNTFSSIVQAVAKQNPLTWIDKATGETNRAEQHVRAKFGTGVSIPADVTIGSFRMEYSRNGLYRGKISFFGLTSTFVVTKKTLMIIDDIKRSSTKTIAGFFAEEAKKLGCKQEEMEAIVVGFNGELDQAKIDTMSEFAQKYNAPKIHYVSTMTHVRGDGSTGGGSKRSKETVRLWAGFGQVRNKWSGNYDTHRVFNGKVWTDTTLPEDGGLYVPIRRFGVIRSFDAADGDNIEYFDEVIKFAIQRGIIEATTPIFGITEKQQASIEDDDDYANFFDLVYDEMKKWMATGAVDGRFLIRYIKARSFDHQYKTIVDIVGKENDYAADLVAAAKKFTDLTKQVVPADEYDTFHSTYQALCMKDDVISKFADGAEFVKLQKEWDSLIETEYPLLSLIEPANWNHHHVRKYINQLYQSKVVTVDISEETV